MTLINATRFEEEQALKFEALENANIIEAKKAQRRMKFVLSLQKMRVSTYQFIGQKLPRFISVPILSFARIITSKIRPIFKNSTKSLTT